MVLNKLVRFVVLLKFGINIIFLVLGYGDINVLFWNWWCVFLVVLINNLLLYKLFIIILL